MMFLIGKWLAESALMTSPAGPFIRTAGGLFKKIPWQIWAAIGIALALWLGVRWHTHEIHKLRDDSYKAGYAQAIADIRAAEAKKVAPLQSAKQVAEAKIDAGNEGVKRNVQDQNRHVDDNVARLLGVYASQAAGRPGAHAGDGVPQADGGAGAQPAEPRADDGLAGGPAASGDEPTITVPAKQLITRAGICDRDYIALKAWEQTYMIYMQAYDEWLAKTKAATRSH